MGEPAIRIRGLEKRYGALEAVRGIDIDVSEGELFALLGPNGAGKTTTVEILEGHRRASAGEVRVLGHDPARGERAYRRRIGIVLQSTGVEEYLTVRETVGLYAGYYPRPRDVDEVIGLAGLAEQAGQRVRRLSGGQRRRVDLAVALAGDPELLFLDEPTTGFDPSARRNAWEMIRGLTALGKTIFLTTHFMDEAQLLADRVAVIAGGEIVAEGSPRTLGGRHRAVSTVRFELDGGAELPDRFGAERHDDHYALTTEDPTRLLNELTEWALSARVALHGLEVARPSLEDVYLALTAQADADAGAEA
jgi:ABC-2 type transport system ATP-binding protein